MSLIKIQVRIGKGITRLRIEAGYETSRDFAIKYNQPPNQYSKIEQGETHLCLKSIYKILKIHNIDFFDFCNSISKK
jgi:hypothetical protein